MGDHAVVREAQDPLDETTAVVVKAIDSQILKSAVGNEVEEGRYEFGDCCDFGHSNIIVRTSTMEVHALNGVTVRK